jgi:hypothetical protein
MSESPASAMSAMTGMSQAMPASMPSRIVPNVLPARRAAGDYGASEARRSDLMQRAIELLAQLSPDGARRHGARWMGG